MILSDSKQELCCTKVNETSHICGLDKTVSYVVKRQFELRRTRGHFQSGSATCKKYMLTTLAQAIGQSREVVQATVTLFHTSFSVVQVGLGPLKFGILLGGRSVLINQVVV